ncbi:glycosyltransferase [Jiella endophytica]|uniref:Glycosyltransferase n=2 Tax=Jiella endophytica TaxID=2558362 RepID=A0A4Y8RR60_9HYPH|nr:glycosyltransferase [Jiella endophytica]
MDAGPAPAARPSRSRAPAPEKVDKGGASASTTRPDERAGPSSSRPQRSLVVLTIVLAFVSLFFVCFPGIDIAVSALFYEQGRGFFGASSADLATVRDIGNGMTAMAIAASVIAILAGLSVPTPRWLLRPCEGLYILAVYAIAPGLIVNAFLKSTAGRPRPRNLIDFGGSLDFTPVWQFAGECSGNCSFSSGEAASAAAILALVFILPRRDRLPLGIGFGAIVAMVSLARVAAGGHFISDVLVSWIITLTTIVALRPLLLGARGRAIDAAFSGFAARLRSLVPVAANRASSGLQQRRIAAEGGFLYEEPHSMDTSSSPLPAPARARPRSFATVSVVVPAKNEAANLAVLVPEIAAALAARSHEIVVVDDGSTDTTAAAIETLRADGINVRHIRHERSAGQSRAVRTGVLSARGDCVVTIDGDGQNDPAFIPAMVERLEAAGERCGLVAGQRTGRTDSFAKRVASKAANRLRTAILADSTRDTGCGLKALPTELFRRLPYFDGWHRYLPALVLREELTIAHLDVKDRQRRFGQSNYGIFDRAARGALDLFGVWWILRRGRRSPGQIEDVTATKE